MKAYEILVDQVLEKLREGVVPWKQTWTGGKPKNYVSDKHYRGFNRLVLSLNSFTDSRYLTAKQIQKLGGKIRRGSTGTKIFFFKTEEDNEGNEVSKVFRYYTVFNIEQTVGVKDYIPVSSLKTHTPTMHSKAQQIVTNYRDKPVIYTGSQASYNLTHDTITMPSLHKFKKDEDFFATFFHELIHSTGNIKRLGRLGMQEVEHFGSKNYSKEELIAELGSMFLCHEAGITSQTFENSVSYIQGWLTYLQNNPQELITASGLAEKASDYILGNNVAQKI